MTDLKKRAKEVAEAGRFGDSQLIHVAPEELRGLASLMPDGKLTTNPKTGLPEAFFFLPFLAGLGAIAPAAASAAVPAAAGLGATAAGLGAAGAGAAGLAGLSAAAAPAATGALGATGAGLAASGAAPALAASGATAAGLGAAAPAATGALSSLPVAGAAGLPSVMAGVPMAGTSALPAASGGLGSLAASGSAGTGAGAGTTGALANMGGQAGAALAGPASFANPAGVTAAGLSGAFPAAPAAAGAATKGGLGGLLGGMDMSQMLQYGALASMMMPQGGGDEEEEDEEPNIDAKSYERGPQAEAPDGGRRGGTSPEFDYFPRSRYFAGGGLVKGYNEGGLASLAPQSPEATDDQLIDMTVAALKGQVPNPDAIIQQFIQVFGPDALRDLIEKVQGGGDGMSDSIPAMVDGQEPAAISSGEYIVPADVVSGLGNGDTNSGAQQLDGMVDRTRMMRGGGMVQPPAMNPMMAMPR